METRTAVLLCIYFFFFLLLILALEANLITWKLQPAIKSKIKFVEPTVREEGLKKKKSHK